MPLFWVSVSFVSGVVLGNLVAWPSKTWLFLAVVVICLSMVARWIPRLKEIWFIRGPLPVPIIILIGTFLLGAFRFRSAQPDLNDLSFIAAYNDREDQVAVVGMVSAPPDVRDSYQNVRMQTEQLHSRIGGSSKQVDGLLLVRLPLDIQVTYGDRLVLRGWLLTPPEHEEFSYREYLARKNIYSTMSFPQTTILDRGGGNKFLKILYAFKNRALGVVYQVWPDPEASLLAGILLGVETGISRSVQDAFRDTGTTHIIAISGFNITIIAGLFMNTFGRWLGARRGALVSGIGVAMYTLLVGADAAVVRAAIMGCLGLFARQIGRRQHALNSLAFTAGLMALHNPEILWDVGFQLSFAATMGLVLYADPFSTVFVRLAERVLSPSIVKRLVGPVGEYFLFTLAAQITTLPVMAYHFGRLSVTSLIANPVILPAQPPIMILGGVALILGTIFLPLGRISALLVWPFVTFTIRSVEVISKIEWGVWVLGDVALTVVIIYYGVLVIHTNQRTLGSEIKRRLLTASRSAFVFSVLAVMTIIIWRVVFTLPDGNLHLTLLDVNGGESLLVESPTGMIVLINGGPSRTRLSEALGRRLPPFRMRLDTLVIAATREDAVGGLVMSLDRFHPQEVVWTGDANASRSSRHLHELIPSLNIPLKHPHKGQILQLGLDAELEFLWVGDRGSILSLRWRDFRAVLPIGADFEALEALEFGRGLGQMAILLLADSGYAPLNPTEWIENIHPNLVLLSVERANEDRLPSPEVMASLEGYALLRTDVNGWVRVSTDGEKFWVEIEK